MTIHDIQNIIEGWAPREIAWDRDNIGLQLGALKTKVKTILVTLSVTDRVIIEARRIHADLIITHHPLIFHPLKAINDRERVGKMITMLLSQKTAVYCAHTNLDFTRDGVSFSLAKKLGLKSVDFLHKEKTLAKKVVVFVPPTHAARVRDAMAAAGAGIIGNYEVCSFSSLGTGSFKPTGSANPFTGPVGKLSTVDEVRLEMTVPAWRLKKVINSIRIAHPYEEIACDVYTLANEKSDHGAGAIGQLPKPMKPERFLDHVRRSLKTPALRTSRITGGKIHNVACCGGGGSYLLPHAISQNADAFITGDVSFHRFEETDNRILLIDAGHHETEYPILQTIVKRLRNEIRLRGLLVKVVRSGTNSNFIHYFT